MEDNFTYSFSIEWLPNETQHFHGPKKRMKEMFRKYFFDDHSRYTQEEVIKFINSNYPRFVGSIDKIKFYKIFDIENSKNPLYFLIVWCNFSVETREELFKESEFITSQTGWYPLITGHRIFHHHRKNLDFIEQGLRKSMNRRRIEEISGFGELKEIINFSKGKGTSILLRTTNCDIILDAGMPNDELKLELLRKDSKKWLIVSHNHRDHIGGIGNFITDNDFLIAINQICLELLLNSNDFNIKLLPSNFFYRLVPLWYRSKYEFVDHSQLETFPTYHYPGSMGYIFTFSNGETLFYSGDMNVSSTYLTRLLPKQNENEFNLNLGRAKVDIGILEAAFIGRDIGTERNQIDDLIETIDMSINNGRNHLLLAPSNDYGYFLFLHLYEKFVSKSNGSDKSIIFVDTRIIRQIEIIEWHLKRKHVGALDNALIQFLKNRQSLAESVRVYDFFSKTSENLKEIANRKIPSIFILDDRSFTETGNVSKQLFELMSKPGLDISRIGKSATKPLISYLSENNIIKDFDEQIWLLHSSEKQLTEYLLKERPKFDHVFLFHNYPNKIERFAKTLKSMGYKNEIKYLN